MLAELLGIYEFAPNMGDLMGEIATACSEEGTELGEFCYNVFFYLFGQDSEQMEQVIKHYIHIPH